MRFLGPGKLLSEKKYFHCLDTGILVLILLAFASGTGAETGSLDLVDLPSLGGPPPGDISTLDYSREMRTIAGDAGEDLEEIPAMQPGAEEQEAAAPEVYEGQSVPPEMSTNTAPLRPSAFLLDLVGAQRRALAQNPSLTAGAERVEQARQMVVKARSLYFPQIDVSYRYTFTWLPSDYVDPIDEFLDDTEDVISTLRHELYMYYVTTSSFTLNDRRTMRNYLNDAEDLVDTARGYIESPQENATANLTAGWLLFDGFAREFLNAMAKHGYGEAKAAYRDGQRILLDAIAQAYYGGQYAREQIAIAESAITFFERLVKEAEARRAIGRGPTSHVLNFQTALYAAKGNLLRARREYELARIALSVLLGYKEGYLPDTVQLAGLESETPETMQLPESDAMLALAYAYRPDLEQRELGVKRARAAVRREYARFAPQIAAFASASTLNINDTSFDADRIMTTVGINASMTLFSGGRRRAELIEAKHARRESEWHLVETERRMAGEVNRALLDLKMSQEALTLNRNAAECVQKNRDLVEKEYRAGKAMLVQLNQAQNDYMQAAGMLAQARVAVQRSWQALHHATGVSLALLTGEPSEVLDKIQKTTALIPGVDKEKNNE